MPHRPLNLKAGSPVRHERGAAAALHLPGALPALPAPHVALTPRGASQVEVTDRVGLLHDVTQALWERELTGAVLPAQWPATWRRSGGALTTACDAVHRAHVSTSPSDHAVDLFYVTGACRARKRAQHLLTPNADNRNELPNADRFKDVQECARRLLCRLLSSRGCRRPRSCSHVRATLGDPSSKFSLYPAPVTNCRCGATIPCDGTICGGRRFAEAEGANAAPGGVHRLVRMPNVLTARLAALRS